MECAFTQAETALEAGEVPIGCAFVLQPSGTVLAQGCNDVNRTNNATRHAELVALDALRAAQPAFDDWTHVTCYVTCEPCVMCAHALIQLNVACVVYGCANDRFGGFGSVLDVRTLAVAAASVSVDVQQDTAFEARAVNLLRTFYAQQNPKAPEPLRKSGRTVKLMAEQTDMATASDA